MSVWWSWGLALLGIAGMFVVGKKNPIGWLVLIANETVWVIYSLESKQYGFLLGSFAYCVVYVRSFLHWKKQDALAAS